jgi:hypothetical protein
MTVWFGAVTPNAVPPYFLTSLGWRRQMHKAIYFGIAAMLVLVGTWATSSGSQVRPQFSGDKIVPLELMMNAKNLPIQQYDAI